jgi:hypothetical protein
LESVEKGEELGVGTISFVSLEIAVCKLLSDESLELNVIDKLGKGLTLFVSLIMRVLESLRVKHSKMEIHSSLK